MIGDPESGDNVRLASASVLHNLAANPDTPTRLRSWWTCAWITQRRKRSIAVWPYGFRGVLKRRRTRISLRTLFSARYKSNFMFCAWIIIIYVFWLIFNVFEMCVFMINISLRFV